MKRRVYHVTKRGEGWEVRREGSAAAESRHGTQLDAVAKARRLARSESLGQLKVHGRNGRIREERTYGRDPSRSKG